METISYSSTLDKDMKVMFREELRSTSIQGFGIDWMEIMGAVRDIPAQGARFNIHFEGRIFGDRITGAIRGTDYLTVRADGSNRITIFASIETDDGARIALHETGVLVAEPSGQATLHLNMDFNTADPRYAWLNRQRIWGHGKVDLAEGKITVTGFTNY